MHLFFSTVVRNAPLGKGGEVVRFNWERKMVEHRVPILFTDLDQPEDRNLSINPRGGPRGGRGIEILNGQVIVASYHQIKVYDLELRHQRDISHPLMVGLHEIFPVGENRFWVAATAVDAALEVDLETGQITRQFWPREMPGFQRLLSLAPMKIDKNADNRFRFLDGKHFRDPNHLHLNSVICWKGEMYALFNALGVVANLSREELAIEDPALSHGHNLIVLEDGTTIVNDTFGRAVRFYDLKTGKLQRVINLTRFEEVRKLAKWHHSLRQVMNRVFRSMKLPPLFPWARPLFVRGLDVVKDHLFVGVSPASILRIDWRRGELVDVYRYSRDVRVCIHGLKVVPP